MTTLQDKLQYHNNKKFEDDNEGFVEVMRENLLGNLPSFIDDGKKSFEQLEQCYKEYYKNGQNMLNAEFKQKYSKHTNTIKYHACTSNIKIMQHLIFSLQIAIENNQKDDINQYTYEVFAFKKKYFECLYAIQGVDVEEPEFDLRQFDEFTGLNLAQINKNIPINSKNLTFNQIGTQSIINSIDSNNQNKGWTKKFVSENIVNEKVEIIKVQPQKAAPSQKEREEQGKLQVIGEIKIHDSPCSLYYYSKMPKERVQQLYMLHRPKLTSEDLPIEQTLTCTIY